MRKSLLSSFLSLRRAQYAACSVLLLLLSVLPAASQDAERAADCINLTVEYPDDKRVAVITNSCDFAFTLFWVNTNCTGMMCRAEIPPSVSGWKLPTLNSDPFASVYRICNVGEHTTMWASGDLGDCVPD